MMTSNVLLNPAFGAEDDARLCVDNTRPKIQELIDYASAKYKSGAGVLWALQWGYADLLRQFAGDMTAVEATAAAYLDMPEDDREAARDCKGRVQQMLTGVRLKGFTTNALAWTMLGALSNMNRQMVSANLPPKRAKREADEYMKHLIMALNHARRTTVN
jgi:hypothetical protein